MLSIRIIVVASTLASGGIVGTDGLAATGARGAAPTVLAQPRPVEAPARRLCPERGWPYGAPRCVAVEDRKPLRIIALDAVRSAPEAP